MSNLLYMYVQFPSFMCASFSVLCLILNRGCGFSVRHPFSRLESAFRSKFARFNHYFMRRHGLRIINTFRTPPNQFPVTLQPPPDSSEPSHVTAAFKKSRIRQLRRIWEKARPTFKEFLLYVLDRRSRERNRHWDSLVEVARPCSFKFS